MVGQVSWADLPMEMLSSIAKRLDDRQDVLHFRAVCSSWRKTVPLPKKSFLFSMKLPCDTEELSNPYASFILSESKVFRLEIDAADGSGRRSWLVKVREQGDDGTLCFVNPFSMYPLKKFPDSLPKLLDTRNFRISEVTKVFSTERIVEQINDKESNDTEYEDVGCIYKAEICTNFRRKPYIAMVKKGELWYMKGGTGYWCLLDEEVEFRDIINFNDTFYTIDIYGVVSGYNQGSMGLIEVYPRPSRQICEGERYLVESCGELFTVHWEFGECIGKVHYDDDMDCFYKEEGVTEIPVKFRVFRGYQNDLGFEERWREIRHLGDRVFFVSHDCSFSFSARDFPGCRGNCIIFVDEIEEPFAEDYNGNDDEENEDPEELKNGKVGLFFMEDGRHASIKDFPEYLKIFWPPPSWLRSNPSPSGH
ncbi:hypothetical protein SLA2020_299980 [Shorea laevis]